MKNSFKKQILKNEFLKTITLKIYKIRLRKSKSIKFGIGATVTPSSFCEGNNFIGANASLTSSYLGFGSYISKNSRFEKTKIGKYSSIGKDVRIIFGKHPSSIFVSTHPSFFSTSKITGFSFTQKQLFQEFADFKDPVNNYSIVIGNDVWIGAGVSIMEGIEIGDGAIVAAGAVVVKDVLPYSIVGGVPAKIIKYRFNPSQIEFLLELKWWEKDFDWIQKNSPHFINIDYLINHLKDNEK